MHEGYEFETYLDQQIKWRWRFYAVGNSEIIAVSSESYDEYRDCRYALDLVKKFAESAPVK